MDVSFVQFVTDDGSFLIEWLNAHEWPFHGYPPPNELQLTNQVKYGHFDGDQAKSFWILDENENRIGFIRLFNLMESTVMFDLRIAGNFRGKGTGTRSLKWLTAHIFETMPKKDRIEAHTRIDNYAMREVFKKCGYKMEIMLRLRWPTGPDTFADSLGYIIRRSEWEASR